MCDQIREKRSQILERAGHLAWPQSPPSRAGIRCHGELVTPPNYHDAPLPLQGNGTQQVSLSCSAGLYTAVDTCSPSNACHSLCWTN